MQNAKKASRIPKPVRAGFKPARTLVKKAVSGSDNINATKVAMSMSLPAISEDVRFASEFSTKSTAVANPWSRQNIGWTGTGTSPAGSTGLPTTDMFCARFRNPLRNTVVYDANPSAQISAYQFQGQTSPNVNSAVGNAIVFNNQTGESPLRLDYALPTMPYAPHGPVLYGATDGKSELRFFWMDVNQSIVGTFSSALVAKYTWKVYGFANGNTTLINSSIPAGVGATTITFATNTAGYFAIAQVANGDASLGAVGTFSSVILTDPSGGCGHFCHLPLPNYTSNVLACEQARILGVSVMYTNEASPLNKQGKIAAVQAPVSDFWTEYASGGYQSVASAADSCVLPAENGMYGFLKPTQPSDFDMIRAMPTVGTQQSAGTYPLNGTSDFIVMYAQITNTSGQDGYWTFANSIEYVTTDVWREVCEPDVSSEDFRQGALLLKTIPQFTENPLHFKAIFDAIKRGVAAASKAIVTYGPGVIKAASTINSLVS